METTLHRELKDIYADDDALVEMTHGRYRIDVVAGDELIEIQCGALAVLRDKILDLLQVHRVRVVKPIILRKWLIKRDGKGGQIIARRLSPRRGRDIDIFRELIYFTRVFPHPNLSIETPLIDIEEWRYPGHGRRRWRRDADHVIEDQKLVTLHRIARYRSGRDLMQLIPDDLPTPFHTAHLAQQLNVSRKFAQQIVYCLKIMGTTLQVGKEGNALLYQRCVRVNKRRSMSQSRRTSKLKENCTTNRK